MTTFPPTPAAEWDWPATRRSIDTAIGRARTEIGIAVRGAVGHLPAAADAILAQVADSLDDIDQTIPPEEDDAR